MMDIFNITIGNKVVFTCKSGEEQEKIKAKEILTFGEKYTINSFYMGKWHSTIELAEFPGKGFNTVMFNDAQP